jgi:hypothetical protein
MSSKTIQKGKGRTKERRRRKESQAAAAPPRESPRRRRKTRRRKRRKTTMMKMTRTRIATCPGRSASCPACEESSAMRLQSHLWEIQYICLRLHVLIFLSLCSFLRQLLNHPEPVFVNLLRSPGIDSRAGGPVRQP